MEEGAMDDRRSSLAYVAAPLDPFDDYAEQDDNGEPADGRPSILITFQNSASYYTSYMGGQGGRNSQQGGRRKNSDAMDSPVQQNHHPIVVMNEYPNPGPVLVAVNSRKHSCDRGYNPFLNPPPSSTTNGFSGPQGPPGPSGPPGPPAPNLPPSRRESINLNSGTLEMPKRRRSSMAPGIATASVRGRNSPSDRQMSSTSSSTSPSLRFQPPSSLPVTRPNSRLGNFETSTLPRGPKIRPPRNSQSMPTLNEIGGDGGGDEVGDFDRLRVPDPSPRPSVCSSANTDHGERRSLIPDPNQQQRGEDEWTPHRKPNWLSLNLDEEREKPRARTRSVYVAEIWPSLVCILTAVLVTLTIYLLISYLYTQPLPTSTRNRILPAHPKFPPHPAYDFNGYHYPYNPAVYEQYPPQFPPQNPQQNLPPPPSP